MTDKALTTVCTVSLYLPGVSSLKEKRSIVRSLLARMRNQFNVSNAEISQNDRHQSAVIAFAVVSNSRRLQQETVDHVLQWMETHYPEALITSETIEHM